MRLNYKRLGEYIQPVEGRNSDLRDIPLMGLSINKVFIPSIANTVGTNMATYRIIKRNQFGYGPVTSRNGEKITIALFDDYDEAMISQAYVPFEVTDTEKLLPEYLMMWFRRPEFDRYARFKSHGSAREIFSWDEMQEVMLPIPHIDKQREIVKEYNTIQNRIQLNEQLIQKLEETAQAIYREWFVEFEFPDEDGKPYKSNGGEMIWNEELEKEIPEGWRFDEISSIAQNIVTGKTPPTNDEENFGDYMPFVTIPDMHNNIFVNSAIRWLSEKGVKHQQNKTLPINSICVSCIGTAGLVSITDVECQTNQQINSVICKKNISIYYMFQTLSGLEQQIKEWGGKGSVGVNMNKSEFEQMKIQIPSYNIMLKYDKLVSSIFDLLKIYSKENQKLTELKDLLLSKLATVT
ncbi:MAG: restriction endonuclease subunit S [Vicingaceae bacterium]|nr:restriction endonuclease subunit S [Vicingaceae bacterium]